MNPEYIIQKYNLTKHIEGGYFNEIYRSQIQIMPVDNLFSNQNKRCAITMIHFLLNKEDCSSWHKLKSDEVWTFIAGTSLTVYIINESGELNSLRLGNEFEDDTCQYQVVIPRNHYFAAEVNNKNSFSFVHCIVSPGFEYEDFELGNSDQLISLYPQHKDIITKFTRDRTANLDMSSLDTIMT